MKRSQRITIGIIAGVVIIAGIALTANNGEYVQGRMFRMTRAPQTQIAEETRLIPAYSTLECYDSDGGKNYEIKGTTYGTNPKETSKKRFKDYCEGDTLTEYYCSRNRVKRNSYNCENGCDDSKCNNKIGNIDGALDTMVIVDTDSYNISEEEVEQLMDTAENLWLEPLTGIGFNIKKIVFVSFKEDCPKHLGECDSNEWLSEDFEYYDNELPEYILMLTKGNGTTINGGYRGEAHYYWLDPEMGSFYNPNSSQSYCAEFPTDTGNYSAPTGLVNYGHKYAKCGYGESENIVSSYSIGGECMNQQGLECLNKNGYQMCPNLSDTFWGKEPTYLSAKIVVHELLHSYGQFGNMDHFGTNICNESLDGQLEEFIAQEEYAPFDSVLQKYAIMCPNVWDNFKNSQQECGN